MAANMSSCSSTIRDGANSSTTGQVDQAHESREHQDRADHEGRDPTADAACGDDASAITPPTNTTASIRGP